MMGSRVLVVLLLQRLDRLRHTRHLFLERVKHLVALIERTLERVELLRVHRQLATELLLGVNRLFRGVRGVIKAVYGW